MPSKRFNLFADNPELTKKRLAVEAILRRFKRVIVAFSGGVDSTLLAKMALGVLGKEHVLAVTADSASLARADYEDSQNLAKGLGLTHRIIATNEVERPQYQANTSERCFFCKETLFEALQAIAQEVKADAILYGVIGDDRLKDRPGHRAALAFEVKAPLYEAGFTKREVRELAKVFGLSNWNKPQNACLSSRIPHGQAVDAAKLAQIERAERLLLGWGFKLVRVRHLGSQARIEVGQEELHRFNDTRLCVQIEEAFAALGFERVSVDREGYREGGADKPAVNEVLLSAIGKC